MKAIESWAVRRAILGLQTRGYGSNLVRVLVGAQRARENGGPIADAVIEALQQGALSWPTDDDIAASFRDDRYYGAPSRRGRLVMLLSAIDAHMRVGAHHPLAQVDYTGLQIEHVLPQSWEEHWPIVLDGRVVERDENDPEWVRARDERNRAKDRVGNLTLVTQSFNGHLSNAAWAEKRAEFAQQNALAINFPIAQAEEWDEGHIQRRAAGLAEATIAIWPSAADLHS